MCERLKYESEAYKTGKKIIIENQETITQLFTFLLDKKELTGEEFMEKLKEIETKQ